MSASLRISVRSDRDAAGVPKATTALQRRFDEEAPDRKLWRSAQTVPRRGAPDTQGAVFDLLLEFAVAALVGEAVSSAARNVVWTIVSHLRSQPDPTQRIVISLGHGEGSEYRLVLKATGLNEEELAEARESLYALLNRASDRAREETEEGGRED